MPPKTELVNRAAPSRPKRIIALATGTAVLIGVFVGGWAMAAAFESPAQRAAAAQPPAASTITARVARGDLSQTMTLRTTVSRETTQTVPVRTAASLAFITRQPLSPGASVTAGTLVSEVNGRPLIAAPGEFGFYRQLTTGDRGPDVLQLQRGLTAAGFRAGSDGTFGASTTRALRALYAHLGYSTPAAATVQPAQTDTSQTGSTVSTSPATPSTSTTAVFFDPTEFLVIGSLPATVVSTPSVGDTVTEKTAVTVSQGRIVGVSMVPAAQTTALFKGLTGVMTGADGTKVPLTLESISVAETASTSDAPSGASGGAASAGSGGDSETKVVFTGSGSDLAEAWLGQNNLVTLTISTAAHDALVVPSSAVAANSDGTSYVLKRQHDGTFARVTIKEQARLGGRSAITAVTKDSVSDGDVVKIQ